MIINRRYSVKKKISETEANIVYKVKDNESGKIRALKLHKSGASDSIPRFKREYHILQTITHPNIVKVYNFGSFIIGKKEQLYFTMEFVRGIPVNLYFRKGGIKSFVPIFLEILQTMDFIHKKGLLHCDLKPGHILVDKRGDFKIVDFGFALLEETKAGKEIGGTLRYLAPEILKGEDPDVRTEIYTLGIIMYESITGKEVFNENSSSKVIDAIINKPLPEMKKKKVVPEYIHSTIGKMTEKLRINRYASIEEIISALESRGKPVKRKKTIKKLLCSNFVGRKEYLNRVFSLLDESKQGRGKIMLVGGMTGIGKTRLMKEVLFHLLLKGIDTHFYRITPEDHQNFNWLLKLIEKCGGNDKSLKKLASEKQTMGSKEQKYDLFKRIEKELTRIKDNQVHIFILDDIAAEYREIWEFLLYISNFIERKPFFIIGSTEKIPIDWAKLVKDGYEDIEILSLSGLSKDETILLTGNFLSVSRGVDNLASFLYAKTEGNPYFIEEFLGEIVRRGLLHKKNNTLVYRTNEIQKITLPEKIDDFIRNRLSTLTDKENEVLNIISVFRGPVPLLWLNRLLSLKEKDTTIVLEKLYHSKFLTISSRNRCFFTHTIVRDMVYNQMNKRKRDSFHRRIFEFLKSLKQTPQIFKEKSFHAYKAGEAEAKELLTKLLEESIKEDDAESGVDAFHKLKSIYGLEYKEKIPFESVMKVASFYRKLGRFKKSINIYSELLSS
jgi:serine/threonine protein kinase